MSKNAPLDNSKRIYLDHAAAAPLDERVQRAMLPYLDAAYGNPSSLHESGRRAAAALMNARERVAAVLGAKPEEIIFTGSGTESDNLAILGAARAARSVGKHVMVSAIEHKAVLESAHALAAEGFDVETISVDRDGLVDVDYVLERIRPDTTLISVMYANNEIGTVEPTAELAAALARTRGGNRFPLLHTDACQAAGYLPLNVDELGIDFMTLNGSKIYGPRGVGILYARSGTTLTPVVHGGEQERGLRSGTENLAAIVGFAEALEIAERERVEESARLTKLRDELIQRFLRDIPNATLNGHAEKRLPNSISITVPLIEGESMLLMLDALGIEASTGSACSSSDLTPSHVLLATGIDPDSAHGSLRFTLGRETTREDIDRVARTLPGIVEKLMRITALTANAAAQLPTKKS
ncbi:MAG: cysteine desulfurase [Patescibacteria group bacterium]|nr:cysteine desulfurase [Patescibacteria group bacterium]